MPLPKTVVDPTSLFPPTANDEPVLVRNAAYIFSLSVSQALILQMPAATSCNNFPPFHSNSLPSSRAPRSRRNMAAHQRLALIKVAGESQLEAYQNSSHSVTLQSAPS